MGTLSEHHKPKAGVTGKCSVPMWMGGFPSGFCDQEAYGEQYAEGARHALPHWPLRDRNGYYLEGQAHLRPAYAPGLCCKAHGGPGPDDVRFMVDGWTKDGYRMWCAFMPGFENLQESIAGFGGSQNAAEDALRAAISRALPGGEGK